MRAIWKISHGKVSFFTPERKEQYLDQNVAVMHSATGNNQAWNFVNAMRCGDIVFLCHASLPQRLGVIHGDVEKVKDAPAWMQRAYTPLRSTLVTEPYTGIVRAWAPNGQTTCARVPEDQYTDFESAILQPYFGLTVYQLQHLARATGAAEPAVEDDEEAFPEGKSSYKRHLHRERNRALVRLAKQRILDRGDRLTCAICGFDFERVYGAVGENFIECHHVIPVSELNGDSKTRVEDLVLLCSNCHRMIHRRRPWLNVDQLRDLLQRSTEDSAAVNQFVELEAEPV